jgi:hypothetical protein
MKKIPKSGIRQKTIKIGFYGCEDNLIDFGKLSLEQKIKVISSCLNLQDGTKIKLPIS